MAKTLPPLLRAGKKSVNLAAELKRVSDFGCSIVVQSDSEYPPLLREIYDPPIVLYVKGRLATKDKNAVAIVGSRRATHYGIETARKLGLAVVRGRHRRQRRSPETLIPQVIKAH